MRRFLELQCRGKNKKFRFQSVSHNISNALLRSEVISKLTKMNVNISLSQHGMRQRIKNYFEYFLFHCSCWHFSEFSKKHMREYLNFVDLCTEIEIFNKTVFFIKFF